MGRVSGIDRAVQGETDREVGHLGQGYRLDGSTVDGSEIRELQIDFQNVVRASISSDLLGALPWLRGVVPVAANDFSTPRTR